MVGPFKFTLWKILGHLPLQNDNIVFTVFAFALDLTYQDKHASVSSSAAVS